MHFLNVDIKIIHFGLFLLKIGFNKLVFILPLDGNEVKSYCTNGIQFFF